MHAHTDSMHAWMDGRDARERARARTFLKRETEPRDTECTAAAVSRVGLKIEGGKCGNSIHHHMIQRATAFSKRLSHPCRDLGNHVGNWDFVVPSGQNTLTPGVRRLMPGVTLRRPGIPVVPALGLGILVGPGAWAGHTCGSQRLYQPLSHTINASSRRTRRTIAPSMSNG
jgi:hypothetical protein